MIFIVLLIDLPLLVLSLFPLDIGFYLLLFPLVVLLYNAGLFLLVYVHYLYRCVCH